MNTEIKKIPTQNLETLKSKVAKLNKRAKRLGIAPMELIEGATTVTYERDECMRLIPISRTEVSIKGESPIINGWMLVATITPEQGGNLVKCVPGESVPKEYRQADTRVCDHCNTKRHRKDVFIIKHEDGSFKQVGRNCIADFLGHASPEALIGKCSYLIEAQECLEEAEEYGGYGFRELELDIVEVLAATAMLIRQIGWVSKAQANSLMETSTSELSWEILNPPTTEPAASQHKKWIDNKKLFINDTDRKLAEDAVELAKNLPEDTDSDYLHNLRVACNCLTVRSKNLGITCSAVAAYMRERDREAELQRQREKNATRGHVGEIKKRQDFEDLIVVGVHVFENYYGTTTIVRFEDTDGNILVWKSSTGPEWASDAYHSDEDVKLNIKATVKEHGDYKGVPQTIVTRVKLLTEVKS
jgi:hypothetical protein